jgi:hypothetical protein
VKHETVNQMFQRYHEHKAKGIKHTPLHTLKECCEEAGIYPSLFGRYAAQHPNPPQPVLRHAKNVGRGAVKYYRKHEFVQWVNQVRQQKEKAMPDIKTALQEALSKTATAWAEDDEAHHKMEPKTEQAMPINTPAKAHFAVTNNVCRATFDCIKHNPGIRPAKRSLQALSLREGTRPHPPPHSLGRCSSKTTCATQRGCCTPSTINTCPSKAPRHGPSYKQQRQHHASTWSLSASAQERSSTHALRQRQPLCLCPWRKSGRLTMSSPS